MDIQWIPIGRGSERNELEKVVESLKKRWQQRYDYRIEENVDQDERFRLLVKHR